MDFNTIMQAISWLFNSQLQRERLEQGPRLKMINHLVEITGTFQGDTFMEFFTFKGINGDLALSLQQSWLEEEQNHHLQ